MTDIFREPKPAAGFYKSQCEPEEEIVLEPAFHWAAGDEALRFTIAMICSNCDHLKLTCAIKLTGNFLSKRIRIASNFRIYAIRHSSVDLTKVNKGWGDLRIEGFLKDQRVISRMYSRRGVDQKFSVQADDTELSPTAPIVRALHSGHRRIRRDSALRQRSHRTDSGRSSDNYWRQSFCSGRRHWRRLDSCQGRSRNGSPHRHASSPRHSVRYPDAARSPRRARIAILREAANLVDNFWRLARRRSPCAPRHSPSIIWCFFVLPLEVPEIPAVVVFDPNAATNIFLILFYLERPKAAERAATALRRTFTLLALEELDERLCFLLLEPHGEQPAYRRSSSCGHPHGAGVPAGL